MQSRTRVQTVHRHRQHDRLVNNVRSRLYRKYIVIHRAADRPQQRHVPIKGEHATNEMYFHFKHRNCKS